MSQLSQLASSINLIDPSSMIPDTTFVLIVYFVMVGVVIAVCVILICAVSVKLIKKYNKLKSN